MLTADVRKDYRNDWIKRCLTIKNIDSSTLNKLSLCLLTNENNVAFTTFCEICSKYQGVSFKVNDKISDTDLLVVWDLKDFPLPKEQSDKLENVTNRLCTTPIISSDSRSKVSMTNGSMPTAM